VSNIFSEECENAKERWVTAMNNPSDQDRRVATFFILDETHNFIPSIPRSRHKSLVREQFRTIAAEEREFGLFPILVSQRAEKLDDLVLSECGNRAILSIDSRYMADRVIKTLGLKYDLTSDISENIQLQTW
jgi:DNA helicase HerA-like ATPase